MHEREYARPTLTNLPLHGAQARARQHETVQAHGFLTTPLVWADELACLYAREATSEGVEVCSPLIMLVCRSEEVARCLRSDAT